MSDIISRRDFLFYGGATIAGVTLGELGRRQLARADERAAAWRPRGVETWATSVCRECAAGCGVRARLADDVPVKLEGNPLCPIGRGRLCAKGQAALESYFDPDRLVGPARQAGSRSAPRWERVSWDAGCRLLASQLGGHGADVIAFAFDEHGPLADAWSHFWSSLGARLVWTHGATAERLTPAVAALTGAKACPLFDLERATHVLSFGAPLVEDWLSPVWTQRSFGRFRRTAGRPRGRLVQVDARQSLTARKADESLILSAEQQIVLAYAIASVLLRENRVNRTAIDAIGGDLAAFENAIVARYSPDDSAAATGVPVVTILRMARELTATPQPLVTVATDAPRPLVDATLALNALIGAIDHPGGLFGKIVNGAERSADAATVLGDIAAGRIRPRVVAFHDAAALRSVHAPPDPSTYLASVPFIVSFSPYLDESCAVADLVLPLDTPLESWHAVVPAPAIGGETIALARPAVARRLESRDLGSILRAVARAVGGDALTAFPWSSSEGIVREEVARLQRLRRGGLYSEAYEMDWLEQLERGGWWVGDATSDRDFITSALEKGGWIDPYFEPGLLSQSAREQGGLNFPVPPAIHGIPLAAARDEERAVGTTGQADAPPANEGFPLRLTVFTPAVVSLAGNQNVPGLFELLGQPEGLPWRPWVEVGHETAARFRIANGETVQIESPSGRIHAVAVLVEGLPEGTVSMAFVPASSAEARWTRTIDADVRRLCGADGFSTPCHVRIARL
ncbi:MAG: molybdopterin-dependent oxidoreductase [Acidobacteria bacterium]|nr:molybdopterin-dependent oxidoreductase [Acidobacteriota bacterium]